MTIIAILNDKDDFIAEAASVSNDAYSICYRQSSMRFIYDDRDDNDNYENVNYDNERSL